MIVLGTILSWITFQTALSNVKILFWGLLPGIPFVVLGLIAMNIKSQFSPAPFLGAAIGGLIAIALPYGGMEFASLTYSGGGANIGLGLLYITLTMYVPIAMYIGWTIGHDINKHKI